VRLSQALPIPNGVKFFSYQQSNHDIYCNSVASTSTLCSIPTAVYNSAVPTTTKARALTPTLESESGQEPKQNKKLCQTGMDRYIHIKRSPQHKQAGNQPKINRANASNDSIALLDDCEVQEQK